MGCGSWGGLEEARTASPVTPGQTHPHTHAYADDAMRSGAVTNGSKNNVGAPALRRHGTRTHTEFAMHSTKRCWLSEKSSSVGHQTRQTEHVRRQYTRACAPIHTRARAQTHAHATRHCYPSWPVAVQRLCDPEHQQQMRVVRVSSGRRFGCARAVLPNDCYTGHRSPGDYATGLGEQRRRDTNDKQAPEELLGCTDRKAERQQQTTASLRPTVSPPPELSPGAL